MNKYFLLGLMCACSMEAFATHSSDEEMKEHSPHINWTSPRKKTEVLTDVFPRLAFGGREDFVIPDKTPPSETGINIFEPSDDSNPSPAHARVRRRIQEMAAISPRAAEKRFKNEIEDLYLHKLREKQSRQEQMKGRQLFQGEDGSVLFSLEDEQSLAQDESQLLGVGLLPITKKNEVIKDDTIFNLVKIFGEHEPFYDLTLEDNVALAQPSSKMTKREKLKSGLYALAGAGAGIGYTPIFLQSILSLDLLDLSKSTSLANSVVYGSMASFIASNAAKNLAISFEKNDLDYKNPSKFQKGSRYGLLGVSSLCLPAYLWGVELGHREAAGTTGFDAYIAVATFLSPPLAVTSWLQEGSEASKINVKFGSLSRDEKVLVYTLPILASAARGISFFNIYDATLSAVGWNEENSRQLFSAALGGVSANAMTGLLEVTATKEALKSYKEWKRSPKRDCTCKRVSQIGGKVALAAFSAYESLPYMSYALQGLDVSQGLKYVIVAPYLVTQTLKNYMSGMTAVSTISNKFKGA